MARAKPAEPQKETGDPLESLIERTGADADERRNGPSDDDENTLERDPEDEDPDDEDPEDSDSDDE